MYIVRAHKYFHQLKIFSATRMEKLVSESKIFLSKENRESLAFQKA